MLAISTTIWVAAGAEGRRGRGTSLRAALTRPFAAIAAWHERARARRALAELDPHVLEDIGLEPWRARAEAAKPFWRA
jgi:uncharacterized protein YjiS (DUF1127 family)